MSPSEELFGWFTADVFAPTFLRQSAVLLSGGASFPRVGTAHNITKTRIDFRPGKRFKEMLAGVSFEKE